MKQSVAPIEQLVTCVPCGREFTLQTEIQIKAWMGRLGLCPTCHHKEKANAI
jgi:DNA-directed RNA polymerase subunit RPC12/RpoP